MSILSRSIYNQGCRSICLLRVLIDFPPHNCLLTYWSLVTQVLPLSSFESLLSTLYCICRKLDRLQKKFRNNNYEYMFFLFLFFLIKKINLSIRVHCLNGFKKLKTVWKLDGRLFARNLTVYVGLYLWGKCYIIVHTLKALVIIIDYI